MMYVHKLIYVIFIFVVATGSCLADIVPAEQVYPEFRASAKLIIPNNLNHVNVLLASNSQLKLAATKRIFTEKLRVTPGKLQIQSYAAMSNVSEQPIGLTEAIQGAKNRIDDLKRHVVVGENSYIVAIENFFTELQDDILPTDHALVIIEAPNAKQYMYLSVGVEISREIYREAIYEKKITVGKLLAEKYAIKADDWHGYVTGNVINREQQIIAAVK